MSRADSDDRMKIREALSTCIDVFDPEQHPTTSLENIYSGYIADDTVHVHDSIDIGTDQWLEYERQCGLQDFRTKEESEL